jgi:hypothetical protein
MVPSQSEKGASPPAGQPSPFIEGQPGKHGGTEPEKPEDRQLLQELMQNYDRNPGLFANKTAISVSNLTWISVHGCLCLALRHPGVSGELRKRALEFTKSLGTTMVEAGAWTQEQLRAIEKVEAEEGGLFR